MEQEAKSMEGNFKPKVNERSKKMVKNRTSGSVVDRMYKDAHQRKE